MKEDRYPVEKFNIREAKGEGYYKIMMVNEALKSYNFKNDFPWLLHIEIDLKDITKPFGLPTEKEAKVLNMMEDFLTSLLKKTVLYQFIGRVTSNARRELFFYIVSPKEINEKLSSVIEGGKYSREFEYRISKDDDWNQTDFFFDY